MQRFSRIVTSCVSGSLTSAPVRHASRHGACRQWRHWRVTGIWLHPSTLNRAWGRGVSCTDRNRYLLLPPLSVAQYSSQVLHPVQRSRWTPITFTEVPPRAIELTLIKRRIPRRDTTANAGGSLRGKNNFNVKANSYCKVVQAPYPDPLPVPESLFQHHAPQMRPRSFYGHPSWVQSVSGFAHNNGISYCATAVDWLR